MSNIHTFSLKLAAVEPPVVKLNKSAGFVELGKGHGYFAELLKLVARSPTQGSITKTRAALAAGEGFVEPKDPKLAEFLKTGLIVNGKPNARLFLKSIFRDRATFGGYCFQVVWASDNKSIFQLIYQRFQTVAIGEMDAEEKISTYYLCRDWADRQKNGGIRPMPAFDPASRSGVQFYYQAEPADGVEYYTLPDYDKCLDCIKTEGLLGSFHSGNVENNFTLGNIIAVPNPRAYTTDSGEEVSVKHQQAEFVRNLKTQVSGPGGQKFVVVFAEEGADPDKLVKVQPVSANNSDGLYSAYNGICREQILAANRVPSPAVVGISVGAGLGGESNTIRAAFELYMSTVCRPDQVDVLEGLREVLGAAQFSGEALDELEILSTLPLKQTYSEDLIASISSDGELRRDIGRDPLPEKDDKAPLLTEEQKTLSGSPAGQAAIDAMLALLSTGAATRESCVARLVAFWGMSQENAEAIIPRPPVTVPVGAPAA